MVNMRAITKSIGTTASEKYLAQLCERSFLNLWSYPNVFRDQGRRNGKGDGKELCDLLVVCGNHIIIFSEKTIAFQDTGDIHVDWQRWFREAIWQSAHTIRGAERWIIRSPNFLFLDPKCTQRFPLDFPESGLRQIHRVVVARGAAVRCRQWFGGGSGSLCIIPGIQSACHTDPHCAGYQPFGIGDIDPNRGFVHVLDDISLEILLTELDTITDFINYLSRKEKFVRSGRLVFAAGEEELLAYYLRRVDENGDHNFTSPSGYGAWRLNELVILEGGLWDGTYNHPQYLAKKEADKISYLWDGLIARFTKHMLAGTTLTYSENFDVRVHERGVRFMALEPRFRRRILSERIASTISRAPFDQRVAGILVSQPGEPNADTAYVYLQFPYIQEGSDSDYETYRQLRISTLYGYCLSLKIDHPHLDRVIGVAAEPPDYDRHSQFSEDLMLVEGPWPEDLARQVAELRQQLNILQENTTRFTNFHARAYPDEPNPAPRKT
jgi:hypothetical protein